MSDASYRQDTIENPASDVFSDDFEFEKAPRSHDVPTPREERLLDFIQQVFLSTITEEQIHLLLLNLPLLDTPIASVVILSLHDQALSDNFYQLLIQQLSPELSKRYPVPVLFRIVQLIYRWNPTIPLHELFDFNIFVEQYERSYLFRLMYSYGEENNVDWATVLESENFEIYDSRKFDLAEDSEEESFGP